MTKKLLRVDDVAKIAGLSKASIYAFSSAGTMPVPKEIIGVVLFWSRESIDKWNKRRLRNHRSSSPRKR